MGSSEATKHLVSVVLEQTLRSETARKHLAHWPESDCISPYIGHNAASKRLTYPRESGHCFFKPLQAIPRLIRTSSSCSKRRLTKQDLTESGSTTSGTFMRRHCFWSGRISKASSQGFDIHSLPQPRISASTCFRNWIRPLPRGSTDPELVHTEYTLRSKTNWKQKTNRTKSPVLFSYVGPIGYSSGKVAFSGSVNSGSNPLAPTSITRRDTAERRCFCCF